MITEFETWWNHQSKIPYREKRDLAEDAWNAAKTNERTNNLELFKTFLRLLQTIKNGRVGTMGACGQIYSQKHGKHHIDALERKVCEIVNKYHREKS